MLHLLLVLLHISLLTGEPVGVAAEERRLSADLQIDTTLDTNSNAHLIEAIIAAAPVTASPDLGEGMLEPSAPALESDWTEETSSGVDYAVTPTISLGVAYEMEEIEDLTAELIEMGTAGVDYTSHKVLVRAQWQFDLIP